MDLLAVWNQEMNFQGTRIFFVFGLILQVGWELLWFYVLIELLLCSGCFVFAFRCWGGFAAWLEFALRDVIGNEFSGAGFVAFRAGIDLASWRGFFDLNFGTFFGGGNNRVGQGLTARRPLRTVHASFPAYSSSPSKASCPTQ